MKTNIKAFLGFSLTLLSLNAFSFSDGLSAEQKQYLEEIFDNKLRINLIAEEVQLLNPKTHLKSNFDELSLQIYMSSLLREGVYLPQNLDNQIRLFTRLSNHAALVNLLQASAYSNAFTGDFEIANADFVKALNECQFINDKDCIMAMAQNISWLNYIANDFDKSLFYNKIAISALKETSSKQSLFNHLIWQNNILLAGGNAGKAENQILKEVLMMTSGNKTRIKEWQCYYQLGKSYLQQHKMVQARWFFVQALTLSEGFKNKGPKIKSLLMLAKTKNMANDHALALKNLAEAESLIKGSHKLFKIDVTYEFANTYRDLGNLNKHRQYLTAYTNLVKNYVKL